MYIEIINNIVPEITNSNVPAEIINSNLHNTNVLAEILGTLHS